MSLETINFRKVRAIIIGVIAIVIVLAISLLSVQIVPAGNMGVKLKWDALELDKDGNPVEAAIPAGLRLVIPIQEHILPINVQVQEYTQSSSAGSNDLQTVTTQVTLNFHLAPEQVPRLYQKIGLGYREVIILPAIHETVKQVTAKHNAAELIQQREVVKAEIEQELRTRLLPFDIITDVISITEFSFSQQFAQAVENKVAAEQNAQTAQNIVAQKEAEARQRVAEAEGYKQAKIKEAEGDAQAIILKAQAEGEKVRLINQYLAENPQYLEWLRITVWNGQLPDTLLMGENVTPLLQVPSKTIKEK